MKDEEILRLYRQRDEQAIAETQKRYGALCYTIACNVVDYCIRKFCICRDI